MRAVLLIARTELRRRLRDRSAYVIGLIAPLGLALLVGGVLANLAEAGTTPSFAIVDLDEGRVAAGFTGTLEALAEDGVVSLERVDRNRAAEMVDDDTVGAAFVLPAGLSDAWASGEPARIEVIANPQDDLATGLALGMAEGFAADLAATQVSVATVDALSSAGLTPEARAELAARAATTASSLALVARDTGEQGFDYRVAFAAGMAVFFMFLAVQFGILSLLQERAAGTLPRLLAAPIRPGAVVFGKALAGVALGIVSMTAMVVATSFPPIAAEWGDPLGVALLIVAGSLAATGIVALVVTLVDVDRPEAARSYSELVVVVLGLAGGSFFAMHRGPDVVAYFSYLTPHRWMLDGLRYLATGSDAGSVLPAVGAILAIAVVTGGIGLLRAGRLVAPS